MLRSSIVCIRPVRRLALILGMITLFWSAPPGGDGLALDLEAQRKLVNKGVIGMLGDGARGTDFAMIADLATILDEGYDRRILPMAGTGSVRAIEDLLLLRGVDVVIVQADVLDFYKKAELFSGHRQKGPLSHQALQQGISPAREQGHRFDRGPSGQASEPRPAIQRQLPDGEPRVRGARY